MSTEKRRFYSADGEPIRVTLPDGSVALVGEEPRELDPRFWRAASRAGCLVEGSKLTAADLRAPEAPKGSDPHERSEILIKAMLEAAQHDLDLEDGKRAEADPAFKDAFTKGADPKPNVRWLEKRVGFVINADERDRAWAIAEVQLDVGDGDSEDGED